MRKYRRFVENLKGRALGAAIWVCATRAQGNFLRRRRSPRSGISGDVVSKFKMAPSSSRHAMTGIFR
jgi:hypothetical protein